MCDYNLTVYPFPSLPSTLPLLGLDPPTDPSTSSTSPVATFFTGGSSVESVEDCAHFLVLLWVLGGDFKELILKIWKGK